MTPAERVLWNLLRNGQLAGAHFRKQAALGPYVVDFLCAKAALVVEIDGDSHGERHEYDEERTRWLGEEKGYRVVRFTNREVLKNPEGVFLALRELLGESFSGEPPP
jgi:very-short-patch-repair endonuclease